MSDKQNDEWLARLRVVFPLVTAAKALHYYSLGAWSLVVMLANYAPADEVALQTALSQLGNIASTKGANKVDTSRLDAPRGNAQGTATERALLLAENGNIGGARQALSRLFRECGIKYDPTP